MPQRPVTPSAGKDCGHRASSHSGASSSWTWLGFSALRAQGSGGGPEPSQGDQHYAKLASASQDPLVDLGATSSTTGGKSQTLSGIGYALRLLLPERAAVNGEKNAAHPSGNWNPFRAFAEGRVRERYIERFGGFGRHRSDVSGDDDLGLHASRKLWGRLLPLFAWIRL